MVVVHSIKGHVTQGLPQGPEPLGISINFKSALTRDCFRFKARLCTI